VVFYFKELAKIGEFVVWTNCGKPLKAAKIQAFCGKAFINLTFLLSPF
jgi:hypothetical protein